MSRKKNRNKRILPPQSSFSAYVNFFGPTLGLSDPAPTKPEAIKASLTLSQYQFSVCLKQKHMQICRTQ